MKHLHLLSLNLILILLLFSCKKENLTPNTYSTTKGYYIINEGNFGTSNSTLSYYSVEDNTIHNNLFENANNRPLGDVAYSITLINDSNAYITVNNSGKIEVINTNTNKSINTILNFTSPRYILPINKTKAYVSDLYETSINIVDFNTQQIVGKINTGKSTEQIILYKNKVFALNYSEDSTLQIIDTNIHKVTHTLNIGTQPQSAVIDKHNKLWILCDGYKFSIDNPVCYCDPTSKSTLVKLNPETYQIEQTINLHKTGIFASHLQIDHTGENLYFIYEDIYKMSIYQTQVPTKPFIKATKEQKFYNLHIDILNDKILVTDASDYTQNGKLHLYDAQGTHLQTHITGILPSFIRYKN